MRYNENIYQQKICINRISMNNKAIVYVYYCFIILLLKYLESQSVKRYQKHQV